MTSLIFIFTAALVLSLLVYWVLTTTREQEIFPSDGHFNWESASELAFNDINEFYLAQNSIKLQIFQNRYALVFWNLSQARFEQVCTENRINPDISHIVLRITEAGTDVHYSDIRVKTIAGQYKFRLQPLNIYYISLGIKPHNMFIPFLTSDTISLHG